MKSQFKESEKHLSSGNGSMSQSVLTVLVTQLHSKQLENVFTGSLFPHQRDLTVKFGFQICDALKGADVEADSTAEQQDKRESELSSKMEKCVTKYMWKGNSKSDHRQGTHKGVTRFTLELNTQKQDTVHPLDQRFKQWILNYITSLCPVVKDVKVMSFQEMRQEYRLNNQDHLKYLQLEKAQTKFR